MFARLVRLRHQRHIGRNVRSHDEGYLQSIWGPLRIADEGERSVEAVALATRAAVEEGTNSTLVFSYDAYQRIQFLRRQAEKAFSQFG